MNSALALYDRMCSAIAECSRVDEAKDIRDKALALEAYYRQARNLDAEREAANVRLRAERRVGELLKDLARADLTETGKAARDRQLGLSDDRTTPSPYATALAEQGMSRQAAHRFQSLASIPEREFEAALRGPEKPTTAGFLKHAEARKAAQAPSTPRVSDAALWLWGRLRDFENEGYLTRGGDRFFDGMTEAMRADVRRLAPLVANFLNDLECCLEPA